MPTATRVRDHCLAPARALEAPAAGGHTTTARRPYQTAERRHLQRHNPSANLERVYGGCPGVPVRP